MKQPKRKKTPLAAATANGEVADKVADYSQYTDVLRREREWRRLNPGLWRQIEAYALEEARHRRRFAIKTVMEWIRWHDYTDNEGKTVRVSNSYAPIWSRILVMKHPEIQEFIELRPSVYDEDRLGIGISAVEA